MPRAAAPPVVHRTEHTLTVAAPADTLYALVADADRWPAVFAPTVHVHHLSRSARNERFEIWAMVGEEVAHWRSSRILDPQRRYVYFRQEHSRPPVTSMSGGWLVRPLPNGHSEVVLRHRFTVQDDDPAAVDALQEALDRNSERELGALAALTRTGHPADELVFSFTDTVTSPCAPEEAYAFIERADRWPELLPHVARVRLDEPAEGVQHLEMDTVTADGSAHTTRSVRICRAPEWIAYKQQRTPGCSPGTPVCGRSPALRMAPQPPPGTRWCSTPRASEPSWGLTPRCGTRGPTSGNCCAATVRPPCVTPWNTLFAADLRSHGEGSWARPSRPGAAAAPRPGRPEGHRGHAVTPGPRPDRAPGTEGALTRLRARGRTPSGIPCAVSVRRAPAACPLRTRKTAPEGRSRRSCGGEKKCPEPDSNRYARKGQRGLSSPCLHSTIRAGRGLRTGSEPIGRCPLNSGRTDRCCLILLTSEGASGRRATIGRTCQ